MWSSNNLLEKSCLPFLIEIMKTWTIYISLFCLIMNSIRVLQARRALRALRGLVRLKSLVDGPTVKRQTGNTLKCMQTLSRVQSQIQSRRLRMLEENRALQRQLLQKRAKELETLKVSSTSNAFTIFMNLWTLYRPFNAICYDATVPNRIHTS